MKKKVVPTLRQEVKVKVDIVTSDDIKIYYTGKFQDFTARYRINTHTIPTLPEGMKWRNSCDNSDSNRSVMKFFQTFIPT